MAGATVGLQHRLIRQATGQDRHSIVMPSIIVWIEEQQIDLFAPLGTEATDMHATRHALEKLR